jgi:Putative restriction endonuclease
MTLKYGASSIPVYWIVKLVDRQVEVYAHPTASGYGAPQIYKPGEKVPIALDGVVVACISVSDIIP